MATTPNVADWFEAQDAETQLLVIKFGQQMLRAHREQLVSLPLKAPDMCGDGGDSGSTALRTLLNKHIAGIEVLHKKDALLRVQIHDVVLDLYPHTAPVVDRADVDTFRQRARTDCDTTATCGSATNPVPIFVVLENSSIPRMPTVIEASPIGGGLTAYFVSGVRDSPERLITLVRMLTKTLPALLTVASESEHSASHNTVATQSSNPHRSSTVAAISQVQAVVVQQTELENFALGVVDRCRSSIHALNACMTELRRASTMASSAQTAGVTQQLVLMRQKMIRAWDTLRDQHRPLTRANTVETIARLYPGDRNGFKNPNSMANTLRYYSTSFTIEKTKYHQERP